MLNSTSPINLFQGWPSPDLLSVEFLREATQIILSTHGLSTSCLNYGPDEGPWSLRDELSSFLSQYYAAPWTDASRLTITGGASQALACILQVYTDPAYTKNVYMVAPAYFLACRVFEDNGFAGRLKAIPEDDEGINVEHLERMLAQDEMINGWCDTKPTKKPLPCQRHYKNVIYCVPTFSNPSGKTMTQIRRESLVRLARTNDALIITDDVYDFLHWSQDHKNRAVLPRLVDIDHVLDGGPASDFGNAVSNGSFSKILGPGLRTGWTESTPLFADGLVQCGSTKSGGPPSHFAACIIAETFRNRTFHQYLFNELVPSLQHRFQLVLNAIKTHLLPLDVSCDILQRSLSEKCIHRNTFAYHGGYYIYIQFPPRIDAAQLAYQAQKDADLIVAHGKCFEVKGDEASVPCTTTMRICIARETEGRLLEGISRLAHVLRKMITP